MRNFLVGFSLITLLPACGDDPTTGVGPGAGIQVGDLVDTNGDGKPDGKAVSSAGTGVADQVDTNGDGVGDLPLGNGVKVHNWPAIGGDVDLDGDGTSDGKTLDTDGNGIADAVDTNSDGQPDAFLIQPGTGPGPFDQDGDLGGDGNAPDGAGGDGDPGCGAIKQEAQLERGPADIVIALDTSLSMAGQICSVSMNLTNFANGVGDNTHVVTVYEMGLLGGLTAVACGGQDPLAATDLASDAERYLRVPATVDSWNALTMLDREFDSYKAFLRPDAPTHFIVVTDDESDPARGGMLAADFKREMEAKLGHDFYFHAIVADASQGCPGSETGAQYISLAQDTGGEKLLICAPTAEWTAMFDKLQAAVVQTVQLPCDFAIPAPPQGETLDPQAVQVLYTPISGSETEFGRANSEGACADNLGWHYDNPDSPTRIEFCPAACEQVKKGGAVSIGFGCEPQVVF